VVTLRFVAVDIETTGFDVADAVTAVGFALDIGCRVFVQTPGEMSAGESVLREYAGHTVRVSLHADEAELLAAVEEFVADRLRWDDVLLVGYNAETWNAGFDLPFLRSRYAAQDIEWPFRELPYADLYPVLTQRFNTTVDGEPQSDLEGVYAALCDGDLNDVDPFDDSAEAVTAFEEARIWQLATHNVADILRTAELGALAERYCSKSDFQLKSLTPTIHADD